MSVDVLLLLGVAGAVISGSASVLEDILPDSTSRKRWLVIVIFAGVVTAICAAVFQYRDAKASQSDAAKLRFELGAIQQNLKAQGQDLDSDGKIIGAINLANEVAPGNYAVRIAADSDPSRLFTFADRLHDSFRAIDRKYICVIDTGTGLNSRYQLLFGRGINFISASIFHGLASNAGYQPTGQRVGLISDPPQPCMTPAPAASHH
jgi:hypothetical protein